jgi:hypothetical protein
MNLVFTPEQIEQFPIDRLIPNARTHSPEQVAEIAASIKAFGFMSVIFVDEHDRILAGHGRVLAAQLLGLTRVPVIVVRHLSEAEKRAFSIADNKITLNASWNDELLRVELENLGRLAAITGGASFFGAFRCFLGWGSLFPTLAFFGATVRARLATLAFWVALGASAAGARAVSSASAVEIIVFSPLLAGFPRSHESLSLAT